jgi:hypothetical protein
MDKNRNVSIARDSCRYDSLVAARTPGIDRSGRAREALPMRTVDGTDARRVHDLGERFEPGSIMPGKCFEVPYVEVRLNQVASPA